jgi:hypothetical protein
MRNSTKQIAMRPKMGCMSWYKVEQDPGKTKCELLLTCEARVPRKEIYLVMYLQFHCFCSFIMQHSRALVGLCNPGRCYKQGIRPYSTNSPFASFISDVKVSESVAASVEETRRSAPRLSSLGDIEIRA